MICGPSRHRSNPYSGPIAAGHAVRPSVIRSPTGHGSVPPHTTKWPTAAWVLVRTPRTPPDLACSWEITGIRRIVRYRPRPSSLRLFPFLGSKPASVTFTRPRGPIRIRPPADQNYGISGNGHLMPTESRDTAMKAGPYIPRLRIDAVHVWIHEPNRGGDQAKRGTCRRRRGPDERPRSRRPTTAAPNPEPGKTHPAFAAYPRKSDEPLKRVAAVTPRTRKARSQTVIHVTFGG